MGARRQAKRRDWPPNLYQQPSGYFYWRNPQEKKNYGLGRDKAVAFREARAANAHLATMTKSTLVQRLAGVEVVTFEQWLDKYMPLWIDQESPKESTQATARRHIARLRKASWAWMSLADITTKHIADYLDEQVKEAAARGDGASTVMNIRTRLQDIFRMAETKGLIATGKNPVSATTPPEYTVKRERLSLEQFLAIRAKVPAWAQRGMDLALLTGQRVGDIVDMKFSDVRDGSLFVTQQKTGFKLQQDVNIRLDVVNMTIGDAIKQCRDRVVSKYLIHHARSKGGYYAAGDPVSIRAMSHVFAKARDEIGIKVEEGRTPPTFHEIRSLAERLYKAQYGQEFAQSIMGHKHAKMTAEYNDLRGSGWQVVTVKQAS